MTLCGGCQTEITNSGDTLTCNTCRTVFHYACLNIDAANFTASKQEIQGIFVCPLCAYASTRRSVTTENVANMSVCDDSGHDESKLDDQQNINMRPRGSNADGDFSYESIVLNESAHPVPNVSDTSGQMQPQHKLAIQDLVMMNRVVLDFKKMFGDLTSSIKSLSDSLVACREDVNSLRAELSDVKDNMKRFEGYETEIKQLREEVQQLRSQVEYRDKMQLRNDVEISGVNESQNENLTQVVSTIALKLGVKHEPQDMDFVVRAGRQLPVEEGEVRRPRSIIVRFTRRAPRDEMLRAARSRRNITTEQLDVPGAPTKVFINEHLTKSERQLYAKARSIARERNFQYIGRRNGKIVVRKVENGALINIMSQDDLFRL
ncbi:hypothetical protein O0L34_g16147 [Tuta absoluta]|nr:hypothetical protein O0L34_g16147 [Tuta absoluta]